MTIKQTANELDISESTVKKYLKDFDLSINGSGSKATITDETFQALKEITKLRANGLSIQEIKELKSQEPTKPILEEIEETVKITEDVKEQTSTDTTQDTSAESTTNGVVDQEDTTSEEKQEEDISEEEEKEEDLKQDDSQEEGKPRKKRFNFRYVERQISSDSKRVSVLRQRLKNPNISPYDKVFYKEALERRILFLNGWKHILRWITT